jgi:hypothetical protein
MSEDCLYLNIFTPLANDSLSTSLLPVMIFIHGGGFQFGYSTESIYESEYIVNTTNVIVALIQYRLGKCRLSSTICTRIGFKKKVYLASWQPEMVLMILKVTMVYSINV